MEKYTIYLISNSNCTNTPPRSARGCLNRRCAAVIYGSSMLLLWAPFCLPHRKKRCVYSPSAGVMVEYELPTSPPHADTAALRQQLCILICRQVRGAVGEREKNTEREVSVCRSVCICVAVLEEKEELKTFKGKKDNKGEGGRKREMKGSHDTHEI